MMLKLIITVIVAFCLSDYELSPRKKRQHTP